MDGFLCDADGELRFGRTRLIVHLLCPAVSFPKRLTAGHWSDAQVDCRTQLAADSEKEIEVRACTIVAVEVRPFPVAAIARLLKHLDSVCSCSPVSSAFTVYVEVFPHFTLSEMPLHFNEEDQGQHQKYDYSVIVQLARNVPGGLSQCINSHLHW